MSAQHPKYWLAYLSESPENRPNEITTTAPEILDRPRFSQDAQVLLAAADAYHAVHPHHRVVFAAAVTRWLHVDRGLSTGTTSTSTSTTPSPTSTPTLPSC